jgi:hypothetical protein
MTATKFALALCPNPETEEFVMGKEGSMCVIRHIDFSTHADRPSLGVIFEVFPEDAMQLTDELRGAGVKVGVYSTFEKAMGFANQLFSVPKDGTLEEVNLDFGGGET